MSTTDDRGHRPQKKWGQSFLRNPLAAQRIVEAVRPRSDEPIVEVGPGEGALTEHLVTLGNRILALEIDPRLADSLAKRFEQDSIEIRVADALEADLPEETFCAVGNLPYNVGTPILKRFISSPRCRRAVFMLQKEVADRVVAEAGDSDYGYLSLYVRAYSDARIVMRLQPGSFFPRPKVQSAVVVFEQVEPELVTQREELLDLVSSSFRMRRKKLINNLTGYRGIGRTDISRAMTISGISLDVRGEVLSLHDFDRLGAALFAARP